MTTEEIRYEKAVEALGELPRFSDTKEREAIILEFARAKAAYYKARNEIDPYVTKNTTSPTGIN